MDLDQAIEKPASQLECLGWGLSGGTFLHPAQVSKEPVVDDAPRGAKPGGVRVDSQFFGFVAGAHDAGAPRIEQGHRRRPGRSVAALAALEIGPPSRVVE